MKARVLEELARIERECEVRVLLAVESGSRAWGFASPDSDYDVRFLYVHTRDWYVRVSETRDVIEQMLPGDLDVSGWELRKGLRLFAKCNLALNEWLGSPIIYAARAGFAAQLRERLPLYFNPIAGTHHYRKMAQTAFAEGRTGDRIRIKKLFYVLRPLLACRWIEHTRSQPPTEFAALVTAPWVSADEQSWIAELLQQKAQAVEAQPITLAPERLAAITSELERFEAAASGFGPAQGGTLEDLDELLRTWITQGWQLPLDPHAT